ncbi:hypothetical protein R1flu_011657 [Riccia fluitans]|uniref:Uncharacterized protein n=1 Tax=Riccia fluitans TaxID=41844 RepID=A0ABD1Z8D8_9MARC
MPRPTWRIINTSGEERRPTWPWDGKANDDGDDELAENAKLIDDGESTTPSRNNPRSAKILKDGHSTQTRQNSHEVHKQTDKILDAQIDEIPRR